MIFFQTRNEITITPVDAQYESTPIKGRSNVSIYCLFTVENRFT